MKHIFFAILFSTSIFTMDHLSLEINHLSLKKVAIPSIEDLNTRLGEKYYSLAHQLGGKKFYPMHVFMIIQRHETDFNIKNALMEKILNDYPHVVTCFKQDILKPKEAYPKTILIMETERLSQEKTTQMEENYKLLKENNLLLQELLHKVNSILK